MSYMSILEDIPVRNSKKPLEIEITARDISAAKGNKKKPDKCALANAICRQERVKEVRAHLSRVYVLLDGEWVRYETPASLRTEIVIFDRGGQFAPGVHTLRPCRPSLGKPSKNKKRGKGRLPPRGYRPIDGVRHRPNNNSTGA